MEFKLIFTIVFFINQLPCLGQNLIEIPLIQKEGYGHFHSDISKVSYLPEDDENPWIKTYLKAKNAPKNWTDVKYGGVETNIYQWTYQNYISGNITEEWYKHLKKTWEWPDTTELSKQAVKTKIAFAYGKDATGQLKLIIDKNNNHDFSDDVSFIPLVIDPSEAYKIDSLYKNNTFEVSYEKFTNHKIVKVTAPLFITYVTGINAFMANFPEHSLAEFLGETIAVTSGAFSDLSYRNPKIVLLNDSLKKSDKTSTGSLIEKNEFIEIKGQYFRNVGVNTTNNTLILEEKHLHKENTSSPQVGFKSPNFEAKDFKKESIINSKKLKGKYVLLEFWSTSCNPCLKEIPNLNKLYEKTARDKFEMVGIVSDSQLNVLTEIINKKSVKWPQILSTKENNIKERFGVEGYPTNFLIDPSGKIIAKNIHKKELEAKLSEILKN